MSGISVLIVAGAFAQEAGPGKVTEANAGQARAAEDSRITDLGAIWFIGDSITQSNADDDAAGSPRKSLHDLLSANGYTFTYTGHYTANTDGLPATGATESDNLYHYHSGISGSVIGDDHSGRVGMTENMAKFWGTGRTAAVKPDVILVMLGTNDVGVKLDLANAPERLRRLVQSIHELPGVGSPTIYLASIPPNRRNATDTANVTAFNAQVPGIVSAFQAAGKDVRFVDQFTPLNEDYTKVMRGDNLHPNAAGNEVIAQTWYAALSSPVTTSFSATPSSGPAPLTVDFDASATTADSGIASYLWNFGDGTTGSGVTASHTYPNRGKYQAVLTATSKGGQTGVRSVEVTAGEWPGTVSDFHGFDQYDFTVDGLNCKVAVPDVVAEGRPWIWRARFWGHKPGVDIALLEEGYHVVYVDVSNLFGSPKAVARFDALYDYLTGSHGFDDRVVLEGMSRGGLIVYNWAARNPGKVHCIYADAPVCDFKSWPAGFGEGEGAPSSWTACKAAYGFASDGEARAYGGNPVDRLEPLADAGIPLLHVVGDTDAVVPVAENTQIVEARYGKMGGSIEVIHKPGVGHVHGLKDPTPIVEFILKNRKTSVRPAAASTR